MRLWLSVHLPLLPLEALRPSWCEPGPYAVMHMEKVAALSAEAEHLGIQPGMRAGGISIIAPTAIMLDRNLEKEQIACDAVAMALLQFTPEVTAADDFSTLLDVTASLRLFGGVRELCHRVRKSIAALGFTATLGAAPTAMGAWLLARDARNARVKGAPIRRRVLKMNSLEQRLNRMLCYLLPSTQTYDDWLTGIGANCLEDLRKLPRAGLQRRTSKQVLVELDRAYGQAPELFEWIPVPLNFSARAETFDRVEHAEALLFGARGLIVQMVGWLVAMQQAVTLFVLSLEHERGRAAMVPTEIEVALAEPAWHEEHLLCLLKERLARVELAAPVIAIKLEAKLLVPMLPPTQSLIPEPGGSPADFRRLLELLVSRLGNENVLVPAAMDDHRPETCNAWVPATDKPGSINSNTQGLQRPFWILPEPIELLVKDNRPFYMSSLKLIGGPERVEAGWWDDQLAERDYFIGQAADACCYWIYRERSKDARWYLHGLYG